MDANFEFDARVADVPGSLQANVIDRHADALAGLQQARRGAAAIDLHRVRKTIGNGRCPKPPGDARLVQREQRAVAVVEIGGLHNQNRRGHRHDAGVFIFDVQRGRLVPAQLGRQDEAGLKIAARERANLESAGQAVALAGGQRRAEVIIAERESSQIERRRGLRRRINGHALGRDRRAAADRDEIELGAGSKAQSRDRCLQLFAHAAIVGRGV